MISLGNTFPENIAEQSLFPCSRLRINFIRRRIFNPLPFEGFTPVTVVEDKELGISILEKDLQGNVLKREISLTASDVSWNSDTTGEPTSGYGSCGSLGDG